MKTRKSSATRNGLQWTTVAAALLAAACCGCSSKGTPPGVPSNGVKVTSRTVLHDSQLLVVEYHLSSAKPYTLAVKSPHGESSASVSELSRAQGTYDAKVVLAASLVSPPGGDHDYLTLECQLQVNGTCGGPCLEELPRGSKLDQVVRILLSTNEAKLDLDNGCDLAKVNGEVYRLYVLTPGKSAPPLRPDSPF